MFIVFTAIIQTFTQHIGRGLDVKNCQKDFRPFKNSKFSIANLPYSKWLSIIKLFELSISVRKVSE
jgi:hypothetical protein